MSFSHQNLWLQKTIEQRTWCATYFVLSIIGLPQNCVLLSFKNRHWTNLYKYHDSWFAKTNCSKSATHGLKYFQRGDIVSLFQVNQIIILISMGRTGQDLCTKDAFMKIFRNIETFLKEFEFLAYLPHKVVAWEPPVPTEMQKLL